MNTRCARSPLWLASLLFLGCLSFSLRTTAQTRYTITDLGTPDGSNSPSAVGINNQGQVIGGSYKHIVDYGDVDVPWVWDSVKGLQALPFYGRLFGINDAGTVTGWTRNSAGVYSGFLYTGRSQQTIPLLKGATDTLPRSIDADGTVVGYAAGVDGTTAFMYDQVHGTTSIGSLVSGGESQALGIRSGKIAGWAASSQKDAGGHPAFHAFLYDGKMHDLGTFGGLMSIAYGINAAGEVVGGADTAMKDPAGQVVSHAFVYSMDHMYDIGFLDPIYLGGSYATSINASGQVVGSSYPTSGFGSNGKAFLWTPAVPNGTTGKMEALESLILADTGWRLFSAWGINDVGQVVGTGFHNGAQAAFLLTPIETITIAAAKLGVPEFVRKPTGNRYRFTAYIKGSGRGAIHGRWLLDGQIFKSEDLQDKDLSSGTWQDGPVLTIPWIVLQGNHSIQFMVDGVSGPQTGVIESSVTGFDPEANGWRFINSNAVSFPYLPWDGLCMGMSLAAASAFREGQPLLNNGNLSRSVLYGTLIPGHLAANEWFSLYDGFRLEFSYGKGLKGDSPSLMGESDRIRKHLQVGKPWVVGCVSSRHWPPEAGGGHAVVATAVFYCTSAYLPDMPDQTQSVRHFQTYDPNVVGEFHNMDVVEFNSNYSLVFAPYRSLKFIAECTLD